MAVFKHQLHRLGLVIEKITGNTYREELERRILDPLALKRTELPRTRRLRDLDDEGENPNVPWAAGALVSDTHDLARFFSALLSGRLLSEGSLAQMKQTVVVDHEVGDGLGIFSSQLPCGRFWGHEGGILDYATIVAASDDGDRVVVISAAGDAFQDHRQTRRAALPDRHDQLPLTVAARAQRARLRQCSRCPGQLGPAFATSSIALAQRRAASATSA